MSHEPPDLVTNHASAPLSPLGTRDAAAVRHAARLWIGAHAVFVLGTIGYSLIDPVPRQFHWSLWLLFAVGPRFTTVATGICSIAVCILCAAMWAWASWKLGGIDRNTDPLTAKVVRWGGLAFLLIAEPLQRVLSRGAIEAPVYVDHLVRTLEVVLCLAIALHLRIIGRRIGDRALDLVLTLLVLIVALNLLAFAPFWMLLQPRRELQLLMVAVPVARALGFLAAMSSILIASSIGPEQRRGTRGWSAT